MPTAARSANLVRFEGFEVDLRAQELYKAGRKIKLQVQPFQVLAMLLESAGEVVTREEMQKRLWPADTFVDFDHSVNTAIKKLRQALGDDKKKPRFVETLPKRGYRFLVAVKAPAAAATKATGSAAAVAPAGSTSTTTAHAGVSPWVGRVAKLCCEHGHSFALLATDAPTAAERQKLDSANDDVGLSLMIASQKLMMVAEGTPLRILEVEQALARCQARILEGEHYGKTALFPLKLLKESPELNAASKPRQWNLSN
jgi:DNA-binding winged helix-turn-helix (wHTH) protein